MQCVLKVRGAPVRPGVIDAPPAGEGVASLQDLQEPRAPEGKRTRRCLQAGVGFRVLSTLVREVKMTYRCGACSVDWAPAHTRAGACPQCGSGCKRVTTAEPDADSEILYRTVLLVENEAERKRIRDAEFEVYYSTVWPALRSPEVAAEAARWAA